MVEGFKATLQSAIDTGGECYIDISPVEKIDSTGLQCLISFQSALTEQGGKLFLTGESECFSSIAEGLGLADLFKKSS